MNKSKFILLVGVLLIAVAAALLWFSRDKADPDHLVLYGNVDIRQVSLAFETAGRIQSLAVQEGDRVQKGQVLAELNTELADYTSTASPSTVTRSTANLK